MNNTLIIIGGGASIKEGLKLGLKEAIKDKFTCGINYSYRYFPSTYHCFVDPLFYTDNQTDLSSLPLIIGKSGGYIPMNNTIDLPTATQYTRNLSRGTYSPDLGGIFALSLGIFLLDVGTIYLLGYDFGEYRKENVENEAEFLQDLKRFHKITEQDDRKRLITHFYQGELNHRGIGKTSFYHSRNRARDKFSVYSKEEKIKIYNVSPTSRISEELIKKMDYDTFLKRLEPVERCNQIETRKMIRSKLNA